MDTDERMQELQAANAALRVALGRCPIPGEPSMYSQYIEWYNNVRLPALTADPTGRLALERATVQALRERVAGTPRGFACVCDRCKRDRELLAQWDALGLEA